MRHWLVYARILPYIEMAGFGDFIRLQYIRIDRALITALVERWRRETQTFHLHLGEMTITLQDVAVLLGLRVDGIAVCCSTVGIDWNEVYLHLLGQVPPRESLKGRTRVSLLWLREQFSRLSEDATEIEVEQHARAYLLYLLGSTIFADSSSSHVHPMYLLLLEDLYTAGQYAWGSATLAYLYRELGKACQSSTSGIAGCVTLVHVNHQLSLTSIFFISITFDSCWVCMWQTVMVVGEVACRSSKH